ncbi:MAG: methionine--tRNA ligase [Candidatus Yonathbacteria bacterium RIFOXYC1_FULL_52_10]|uniref:Methionine--tRNA ligase n=1 Tax=Candidatus Yonathbacteria bacterium RIFOXYD1_FULL_52_36 TaxID=1802730 RepID=A0A1G2SL44_9BACT|nr:MAG: methionine--tRNA ligase [Candidatus Yonathbacteria bacterium RIFOXYC1_FULL_52_10]OHA85793.1 MAG: methionine--tRNA ligase [Candidatus Yonathbacteria bacterium RIFOXYD1_FULL_52_36]
MKDTFFITTAIPYMNASAHIGHAYEMVLTDILARYHRAQGKQVFFLTGTDEHGAKIVRTATKAGKSPQAFVDEYAGEFRALWDRFQISYDDFIRTSDKERHWKGAQALWEKLVAAGDLTKGIYKGLYCVGCEAFVTEKELVDGKCQYHNVPPEEVEEENYFFDLARYAPQIREAIDRGELAIIPEGKKAEVFEMLTNATQDVSFSRPEGDIPWGVPVPGDPSQMMYVWCDALANYLSAPGYGTDEARFGRVWPPDVQVVGKDIARFHAVIWPAMLLAAGLALPKTLLVHGFITSGGKKMSKSIGNVIDPVEYLDAYGVEAVRFYFAREIPSTEDGDFTKEKFIASYNGNLSNGVGNLVSRTVKMATQYFEGDVARTPETDVPVRTAAGTMSGAEKREGWTIPYLIEHEILPAYHKAMEALEVHRGTEAALRLAALLDEYIADHEPFKLVKTDPEKTKIILANVLYGITHVARMMQPIIPETAGKIFATIGAKDDTLTHFSVTALDAPLYPRHDA